MRIYTLIIFLLIILISCHTPVRNIFGKKSLHEQYSDRLIKAGLENTALGRSWFNKAQESLKKYRSVNLPYREAGYLAADHPDARSISFHAERGEKLKVELQKNPAKDFMIYIDLWYSEEPDEVKYISSSDSSGSMELEIKKSGNYFIRLQPELLKSGEYTITISAGPSLAFPIKNNVKSHIGSFWSDPRDGGSRKHEGVDIFAPFRTPALAVSEGMIVTVNTNNLGGNVVWMKPKGKNYVLYYAHLDTQLVHEGQAVNEGDALGLVGNTGNARFTPAHLHFGIYTLGGAIDPLHFIEPEKRSAAKISASLSDLGKLMQSGNRRTKFYQRPDQKSTFMNLEKNTLLRIEGAADDWFIATLPDGQTGYIDHRMVSSLKKIKEYKASGQSLHEKPDTLSAKINDLAKNETVQVLAVYGDYYFVEKDNVYGWTFNGD